MKKTALLVMSIFLVCIFFVSCSEKEDRITIDLYPKDADLTNAPNIIVEQTDGIDNLGGWQESDMPVWNFTFEEDTRFELELEYSRYNAPAVWGDVLIEGADGFECVLGVRFTSTSTEDNDWSNYERIEDSISSTLTAGDYTVTLVPNYDKNDEPQPQHFINLRSMTFVLIPEGYISTETTTNNNVVQNESDHQQDRKDWEERFGYYVEDITAENIENYTGAWYLYGDISNKYYKFSDNDYEGFDLDGYIQTGIWGVKTITNVTPIEPVDEEIIVFYPSDGVDTRLDVLSIDDIVLYNSILDTYYVREEAIGTPEADLIIERLSLIAPEGSWIGGDLLFSFGYYDNLFSVYPQGDDPENLSLNGVWNIDGDILTLEFDDGTVEITEIIDNEFTVDYYDGITFSIQ